MSNLIVVAVVFAALCILSAWGLSRYRLGRVHDCTSLIPHDLLDLLAGGRDE